MNGKTQAAARRYLERGCCVIPIPTGEKNPNRRDWQSERWTLEDVPRCWNNGQNIGLLNGEPSGWRVCVDMDCPEALSLAGRFLPPTLTSGREDSLHSHWWYVAPGAAHTSFKDTDRSMLLELRSSGGQTLVAPSVHPSGERYRWHVETGLEMERVEAEELAACVRQLATASLIARRLPAHRSEDGGGRHDYALAVAGYLLRRLEPETVQKILLAAWDVRGYPGEREKREAHRDLEGIVRDTARRIASGEPVQGGPTLDEDSPGMVKVLSKWWGWSRESYDSHHPKSQSLIEDGIWDGDDSGRENPRLRSVRFVDIPDPGPRRYLLAGLVPESYPTLLHGDGGVAKSMLTLSFGLALSRGGGKWLGHDVGDPVPVLYLDFELDAPEQRRRLYRLARGEGLQRPPEMMRYMSALGAPPREAFSAALAECKEHGVKLLLVDSLGVAFQGDTEAARDVIGFFQKVLEPFRSAGVTVLVIDHQSRLQAGEKYQSKSAFGSVFKTNLARSVIQVEATERGVGTLTVRLRQKKHNFGTLATPFEGKLTFTEEMVGVETLKVSAADLAGEQTLNAADRIKLALQDGPAYPEELAEVTEIKLKTVQNTLSRLRKAGEVEPTGEREGRSEQIQLSVPNPNPYKGDRTWDATRREHHDSNGVHTAADAGAKDREIKRLMAEGMSPEWARSEICGGGQGIRA